MILYISRSFSYIIFDKFLFKDTLVLKPLDENQELVFTPSIRALDGESLIFVMNMSVSYLFELFLASRDLEPSLFTVYSLFILVEVSLGQAFINAYCVSQKIQSMLSLGLVPPWLYFFLSKNIQFLMRVCLQICQQCLISFYILLKRLEQTTLSSLAALASSLRLFILAISSLDLCKICLISYSTFLIFFSKLLDQYSSEFFCTASNSFIYPFRFSINSHRVF